MCLLSGVERFPLFGGFQCTNFNGRAIRTGNNVHYIEVVRSWEGPLIEVPLYSSVALRFYSISKRHYATRRSGQHHIVNQPLNNS